MCDSFFFILNRGGSVFFLFVGDDSKIPCRRRSGWGARGGLEYDASSGVMPTLDCLWVGCGFCFHRFCLFFSILRNIPLPPVSPTLYLHFELTEEVKDDHPLHHSSVRERDDHQHRELEEGPPPRLLPVAVIRQSRANYPSKGCV